MDPDDVDDERLDHIETLLDEAGARARAEAIVVPPFDPTLRTRRAMRRCYCRHPQG
jgi:hypothetical protein